ALLLHSAGKKIDDKSLTSVLKSAGIEIDSARVKALVTSLEGVNIEELISAPAIAPPVVQAQVQAAPAEKGKKEEKKVSEEEAAEGLGALFG
ncbi:MAG: 50S ribosomal protein L12, partial [Candidatus Thermoplasmatota archaeon]|nr:50S ribosomal protein L12 [Candidatus Thermoplasmatota archaeon]